MSNAVFENITAETYLILEHGDETNRKKNGRLFITFNDEMINKIIYKAI